VRTASRRKPRRVGRMRTNPAFTTP
jgi:hypothetical protein